MLSSMWPRTLSPPSDSKKPNQKMKLKLKLKNHQSSFHFRSLCMIKAAEDYPIRVILSSYYWGEGDNQGIPDGKSDCSLCKVNCDRGRLENSFWFLLRLIP